jgi:hypothetical protein
VDAKADVMREGWRRPSDYAWLGAKEQVEQWVERYAVGASETLLAALHCFDVPTTRQVMVPAGFRVWLDGEWRCLPVELLGGGGRVVASSARTFLP